MTMPLPTRASVRVVVAFAACLVLAGWSEPVQAQPRAWFTYTGEADTDYLNLANWRWAGGGAAPNGVSTQYGNPTSVEMLLTTRHEIGRTIWTPYGQNPTATTPTGLAVLDGTSASYIARNAAVGGVGIRQTYGGIELDGGVTFQIVNGASYSIMGGGVPAQTAANPGLSGFTANGVGTNPTADHANWLATSNPGPATPTTGTWTGNTLKSTIYVTSGGSFAASDFSNITSGGVGTVAGTYNFTGNGGIHAAGEATVLINGSYTIGGNSGTGKGGGHLTLQGYHAASKVEIAKTGTLSMRPAVLQEADLIRDGSFPAELRVILDASNNGGGFNTAVASTLQVYDPQTPVPGYTSPVRFNVELDGYTPVVGHVFPIITATTLSGGATAGSLGLIDKGWDTPFIAGGTLFRFLQEYDGQQGVFLAVQGAPQTVWYADGGSPGGSGVWSAAGSTWSVAGAAPGPLPPGNMATFPLPDGEVTIAEAGVTASGGLNFGAGTLYELSGGPLTLGGDSAAANTVNVQQAAAATISAPLAGTAGLTKAGPGDLTLSGGGTLSGPVTVSQGSLRLGHAEALAGATVTVAGGTLATSLTTALTGLAVEEGKVLLDAAETHALAVGSFAIDLEAGGLVDLGVARIEIAAGAAGATLREALSAGGAATGWNGTAGILSTAAATTGGSRTVGYRVGTDGSAVLAFAAPGDTNLDGLVDSFDLVTMASSGKYGTGQAAVWSDGDFNYDGVVDSFDLVTMASLGVYGTGNYLPLPAAPTVTAVPEPGSVALLGAALGGGAGLALGRRTIDSAPRTQYFHRRWDGGTRRLSSATGWKLRFSSLG